MKVLVSGASGFVGRALVEHLLSLGHGVIPAVRRPSGLPNERLLRNAVDLDSALFGCDSFIHLAGRAHVLREDKPNPLAAYRAANVELALNFARQAAVAGVRRFIFMSSVKVNGEYTAPDKSFTPDDLVNPVGPYAISKWEAEVGLKELAHRTGMELVIIRPPLVYGPGVKGNFESLIRWISLGIPLPLGAVDNRRSLIGLDNLVRFTALCADAYLAPAAAGETFLIADPKPISTTELITKIALSYGYKIQLISMPNTWLRIIFSLVNQKHMIERLLESMVVDDSKARRLLDWSPVTDIDTQLNQMASMEPSLINSYSK